MDLPSRNRSIKQCNQCADSKPSSCYLRMFVIILHLVYHPQFWSGWRIIPSQYLTPLPKKQWFSTGWNQIFETLLWGSSIFTGCDSRIYQTQLTMIVPQLLHSFPVFSPRLPHQQTLWTRCFRRPRPRHIFSLCDFLGTEHIVVFVIAKLTRLCLGFFVYVDWKEIAIVNGTINQQT